MFIGITGRSLWDMILTKKSHANLSSKSLIAILLSLVLISSVIFFSQTHYNIQTAIAQTSNESKDAISPIKLKLTLRNLWADHIWWTRNYIISFIADLPDVDLVAERLLKNQQDLGNAIKAYYGDGAGNKLTELLKSHILGAVDILKAAKAGNSTGAADAEKKWYDNAAEIATFLGNANPNWSREDLKTMLDNHLNLTKAEAVARLTGNYSADISTFDKIHEQAMMMSDILADGIVKQFPNKFSRTSTIMTSLSSSSSSPEPKIYRIWTLI